MSLTYQIREVTVTLPSLGAITTDGAGNKIKHGDKCRVDLYAVKPEWRSGCNFEGFIAGWLTFQGYCETPYKRSQKIMMPDGYKLVALMVDEYGLPTSWDSLPVELSGGIDGLAESSPFTVKNGQVFINDAFIGDGAASANYSLKKGVDIGGKLYATGTSTAKEAATKTTLTDDMREAVIDAVRESDLFKELRASRDAEASVKVTLQQTIEQTMNAAIRNALKPGGIIWNNLGGR